jgi:paraquat-inducible protein A
MKETACSDCGIIIKIDTFDTYLEYACPRCHSVFYRPGESFTLVLAMAITSIFFFIPATFLPIMTISILGKIHSVTLIEAVWFFANDGYMIIALIAVSAGVVIPLILLGLILIMIIPSKLGISSKKIRVFYRYYEHLTTWAMAEVYLISIFVAIVKLSGMAELSLDFGLYSFGFFILSFFITITWFNPDDLWNKNELY